jgi:hypothetical protein
MPSPTRKESLSGFVNRFMSSGESKRSFPNTKQRYAVARSEFKRKKKA